LKNDRKSINSLTSLRFFAAFSIVVYHAQAQFPFLVSLTKEFELEQAVSFFFVLSGFILTYAHQDLSLRNAKQYLISRFWRIYPVHIFALGTLFVLLPGHTQLFRDWQVSSAYLTMTHGWIPVQKFYFAWNSPSWSISAEWFFYICLPVLLIAGRKRLVFPVLITLCSLAGCFLVAAITKIPQDSLQGASSHGLLYINPLARIFEFALGISIALTREKIPNAKFPTLLELLTLSLMVAVCHISTKLSAINTIRLPEYSILWASHGGLSGFSSALLILVFQQEKGLVSKILQHQPLVLLGEISFAMYMLHYIFLCYKFECLPLANTFADFAVFLLVLIAASFFVFSFIETPTRRIFKSEKKRDNNTEIRVVVKSLSRVLLKASLVVLLIYITIPGKQTYENEMVDTVPIVMKPVNFDRRIEILELYRSNKAIYCRFRAIKGLLLSELVECQLLDKDLHAKMFLRQALSAKPEAISAGELFDLKVPASIDQLSNSSYISLKIVRRNGKPLYPQNGFRDDNGSRLLIALRNCLE